MSFINSLYLKFKNLFLRRYPRLYCVCDRRKYIIKFFFAGSSAAIVDLIFLYFFHGVFKWGLVFSTSLAFILSFIVSFALQKFWTFRNYSQKKIPLQLSLYVLNAIIGLNVNGFLMHYLVNTWEIWYMFAQVAVILLIGLYNFIVYKFVVFKIKDHEACSLQKSNSRNA